MPSAPAEFCMVSMTAKHAVSAIWLNNMDQFDHVLHCYLCECTATCTAIRQLFTLKPLASLDRHYHSKQ